MAVGEDATGAAPALEIIDKATKRMNDLDNMANTS